MKRTIKLLTILLFICFYGIGQKTGKWSDWVYIQSDKPIQYSLNVVKISGSADVFTTKVRFRVDTTCNVYYKKPDKLAYRITLKIPVYNSATNNYPTTKDIHYYLKPTYEFRIWELDEPIEIVFKNDANKQYFWEKTGLPMYTQNGETKPFYLWTPCVTEHLQKESYNRCAFSFDMSKAKVLE